MQRLLLLILFSFATSIYNIQAQCTYQQISSGGYQTLAIKPDGTLWAWGGNFYGSLGDGTYINRNVPTHIGTGSNWSLVSTNLHSMAIKTDGTLWGWGPNYYGALGDGSTIDKNVPTPIGTANNWSSVTAGWWHSVAIKNDGTLWAWGRNNYGQVGDGTLVDRYTPIQIGTGNNWSSISAGADYSVGIKTDGTLWAWGGNLYGQLGDGSNTNRSVPVQIGNGSNWSVISKINRAHTMAIKTDGTLWAWGFNNNGQLGDGTSNTSNNKNAPVQIGSGTNWVAVEGGGYFSVGLKSDSTLWSWGSNGQGQLGNGTNINANTVIPVQIGSGTSWASIHIGHNHSVASQGNQVLWSWGANSSGSLGNATNTNGNAPGLVYCFNPLMVRYKNIEAFKANEIDIVEWTTISESSNSHFEVEYSTDGINFETLGQLWSQGLAGNSNQELQYSFKNNTPQIGRNYYRIIQVDIDGSRSFSKVVEVARTEGQIIDLYPNPTKTIINVKIGLSAESNVRLKIFDLMGRLVQTQYYKGQKGSIVIQSNVQELSTGIYFLQVNVNGIDVLRKEIIKE